MINQDKKGTQAEHDKGCISLIFGILPGVLILAIFLSPIPFRDLPGTALWILLGLAVIIVAPVLNILGIIFARSEHKDSDIRWLKKAGLICSIISLIVTVPMALLFLVLILISQIY